jgi:hypothetical protein
VKFKNFLHKTISFALVFSLSLSFYGSLTTKAKAAGRSVTLTPASIAASATDVTITYTTSASEYASGNTIVFAFSPALSNAVANCTAADTDADNNATPDGAFGSLTTTGAVYTFTSSTAVATSTGISLCLRFNTSQSSYSVAFTDTGNDTDYGAALLYVADDNDVIVSADINPSLSFNIRDLGDTTDTNTCDLGTVTPSTASPNGDTVDDGAGECGYSLAIGTNAASGFQAQITSGGSLTNGSVNMTNITEDTSITSGTEGYGLDFIAPAQTGRNPGTGAPDVTITENGNFTDDDTPIPASPTNFVSYTSGIRYTAGGSATDTTRVVHGLAVSTDTIAGHYTQMVTYTVTANF